MWEMARAIHAYHVSQKTTLFICGWQIVIIHKLLLSNSIYMVVPNFLTTK